MVTVLIECDVVGAKEAEFVEMFDWIVGSIGGFEGHQGSRLLHDPDRSGRYVFETRWDDRDRFETVFTSDTAHELGAWCTRELLAGPPVRRIVVDQPAWVPALHQGGTMDATAAR